MIPLTVWNAIAMGLRTPLALVVYTVAGAAVGTIGGHALWYLSLNARRQKAAQRALDEAEAREDLVCEIKRQLCDELLANRGLRQENAELRRLVLEDINHGKGLRVRAHAVLNGRGNGA